MMRTRTIHRRDFLRLAGAAGASSALCFSAWVLARLTNLSHAARESHVPPPEPWENRITPPPTLEPDIILTREPLKIAKRDAPSPGALTRQTPVSIVATPLSVPPGGEPASNPPPTLKLVMPERIKNLGTQKKESQKQAATATRAATPERTRTPTATKEEQVQVASATPVPTAAETKAPAKTIKTPPELLSAASTPAPSTKELEPPDLSQSVLVGQRETKAWLEYFVARAASDQNVSEQVNPRPIFLDRKVEGVQSDPVNIYQSVPKSIQLAISGFGFSLPDAVEIRGLGYHGLPEDIGVNSFLKKEAEALGIEYRYEPAWGHPGLWLKKDNLVYIMGFLPRAAEGEGRTKLSGEYFYPCVQGCGTQMEVYGLSPKKGPIQKRILEVCVDLCKKHEPDQFQVIVLAFREHVPGDEWSWEYIY